MKILLLGATGLLGHNVLQHLDAKGDEVVALVRQRKRLALRPVRCHIVEGELTDYPTLLSAAEGCDAVVNCAGTTDMSLLHRRDYTPVNCTLCEHIVKAMEHHGIRRLVHISTVNTVGYGIARRWADETMPIKEPFRSSFYADSKLCGERIVRSAAAAHPDWHVIVVNPGYMLGPMDIKPSSGRMLTMGYGKRLMVAPGGGKAFVDVRDVATAAVNAIEMGRSGERYIATCGEGHLAISELYKLQAQVMGYRQRVVVIPDWLLGLAGLAGDAMRALGLRTELSSRNVRQLTVHEYYDSSRAIAELQMPQTPIAQSIADFHSWNNRHRNINKEQ